jgi:hypothetical protein
MKTTLQIIHCFDEKLYFVFNSKQITKINISKQMLLKLKLPHSMKAFCESLSLG